MSRKNFRPTQKISWITALVISFVNYSDVEAQIIPDNTLGAESSTINSVDELRFIIEGGATRGANLFHSFSEFNIGEGLSVNFANPEGATNIFSRITGSNISKIFGTLGVEGAANLFLLNPNGIIFGENARIDVGGSFIATTAKSISFADGQTFSARDRLNGIVKNLKIKNISIRRFLIKKKTIKKTFSLFS